jgi:hypothetical protein
MSSEITAEGGTITLSTAPDGEITASSADFAVYVVQQVEGGGSGVTEYATLAELITASEGSLAEGYYTVTETPPVTHPLYPKIVTYWDGAAFEPQISTGFEDRPVLAGELFAWDALESHYTLPDLDDSRFMTLPDLLSYDAAFSLVAPIDLVASPWWRDSEMSLEAETQVTHVTRNDGATSYNTGTMIFAGSDFVTSRTSAFQVLAGMGDTNANNGLSILNFASGVSEWSVGWWAANDLAGVGPRVSGGDIVILSWNATSYDFWVNGTKLLTRSSGMSLTIADRKMTIGGDFARSYLTAGVKFSFAEYATSRIGDTEAAAWTAWLQGRYGIPTL